MRQRVRALTVIAVVAGCVVPAAASAAGGQIVYADRNQVVSEPPAGGHRRALAHASPGFNMLDVSASRSGRRIAYLEWDLAGCGRCPPRSVNRVFVMRGNGTDRHLARRFNSFVRSIDISDDGRKIALTKPAGGTSDNVEIFVMRRNGGGLRRVTHTAQESFAPSFSPNGRKIVFVRGEQVAVVDAGGGRTHTLTSGAPANLDPTYSPNGRKIAFSSSRGGFKYHLWTMRADGSRQRRVTGGNEQQLEPTFAPTGRALAFWQQPIGGGIYGVFTVRLNGNRKRLLEDGATAPSWARSG